MNNRPHPIRRGPRKSEAGVIMLLVVLLVVMFTGLGLLAMRHTRGELRSGGAFRDSVQAVSAAEAGILMVATDMRANWASVSASGCDSYYKQFQVSLQDDVADTDTNDIANRMIPVGFSNVFNHDGNCDHRGSVPIPGMRDDNGLFPSAPLAETAWADDGNGATIGVGPLASGFAEVRLEQSQPVEAPPPPGFSFDDQQQNFGWYYFDVKSEANYGPKSSMEATARSVVLGRATVRSHMKIGPIKRF